MTIIDCPRCHGLKFNDQTKMFDKGTKHPTMRIENVMATTQMIHYSCGNCCHKMQEPYGQDADEKRPEPPKATVKQQTLF
jgi:hypothetical protein